MKKIMIFMALIGTLLLAGCKSDKAEPSSSLASQPIVSSPAPEEKKVQLGKVKGTDVGLNIRKEASTDAEVLGLAQDNSFLILASSDKVGDSWYQIKYNDAVAYVSADFLEIKEYTSAEASVLLNAVDPTTSESSTPEPTTTPESTESSDSESSDTDSSSEKAAENNNRGNDGE